MPDMQQAAINSQEKKTMLWAFLVAGAGLMEVGFLTFPRLFGDNQPAIGYRVVGCIAAVMVVLSCLRIALIQIRLSKLAFWIAALSTGFGLLILWIAVEQLARAAS